MTDADLDARVTDLEEMVDTNHSNGKYCLFSPLGMF